MGDFFNSLSATEKVFAGSAIIGGIFFLVWLVMQFVGGDTDIHDGEGSADFSGDADLSFKVLSFQGMSTFLTMFGLVGLASSRESSFSPFISSVLGVAAGLAMAWVVARLFRFFGNLQSSGTTELSVAVGEEGTVYLTIPKDGVGQVQLTLNNRMRVLDAVSDSNTELPTGKRVQVLRVTQSQLVVKSLDGVK